MRNITKHIIHCSDTPNGKDYGAKDIDKWHIDRGWVCIGYHFVIKIDGTLEFGRPVEKAGAHCKGHNSDSIGTCLIGRDKFTIAQLDTLFKLDCMIKHMYNKSITTHGHTEFSAKTCPNFDVQKTMEVLNGFSNTNTTI